eukprot:536517_1
MYSVATTLTEQLHEISIKYQTLEQQYIRLDLEYRQYKQHIEEIEEQNNDLQIELAHYKEKVLRDQKLKPMLKLHLTSMADSVTTHHQEIEELHEQNEEYLRLIQSLRIKNNEIMQQNDQCHIALERNNKLITRLKKINNDSKITNDQKVNLLLDEIHMLRDEISKLQRNISDLSEPKSKINTPTPRNSLICEMPDMPDFSPRINFIRSMDAQPVAITDGTYSFGPGYITSHSHSDSWHNYNNTNRSHVPGTHSSQLSFIDEIGINNERECDHSDIELDELKCKIEILEMENIELRNNINILKNEAICCDHDMKEVNEMEMLFQKCNDGLSSGRGSENNNNNGINDGKNVLKYKWLCFEFKLRKL